MLNHIIPLGAAWEDTTSAQWQSPRSSDKEALVSTVVCRAYSELWFAYVSPKYSALETLLLLGWIFSRSWAKRPDCRVNWAIRLRNHKANRDARMDDGAPTLSLVFLHFFFVSVWCFCFLSDSQPTFGLFGFNFVVDNGFCYIITRSSMWLLHHFPCFDVRHAPQASRPKNN